MDTVKSAGRGAAALLLGIFSALAAFGLLLALLWLPLSAEARALKLASALLAAGAALALGGFVGGRVFGRRRVAFGAALGLLFGGCSFTYVLGGHPLLLFIPAAGLLGALGGSLAARRSDGGQRAGGA